MWQTQVCCVIRLQLTCGSARPPEPSSCLSNPARHLGRCRGSVVISTTRVDLAGRLSNPPEAVETLAAQGSASPEHPRRATHDTRNRDSEGAPGAVPDQRGRLSNPVQRHLSAAATDEIVSGYLQGSSINRLAAQLGVDRTTIISHLDRRGIERRKIVRKLSDRSVAEAAKRYRSGESLKAVAALFGVDTRTLAREFRRAGVDIRPRRGWSPSNPG